MNANRTVAEYVARLHRRSAWLARVRVAAAGVAATALLGVVFAVVTAHVVPSDAARRTGPEAPSGVVAAAETDRISVSLPLAPALLALALALLVAESVAANVGRIERRTLRRGRA